VKRDRRREGSADYWRHQHRHGDRAARDILEGEFGQKFGEKRDRICRIRRARPLRYRRHDRRTQQHEARLRVIAFGREQAAVRSQRRSSDYSGKGRKRPSLDHAGDLFDDFFWRVHTDRVALGVDPFPARRLAERAA